MLSKTSNPTFFPFFTQSASCQAAAAAMMTVITVSELSSYRALLSTPEAHYS